MNKSCNSFKKSANIVFLCSSILIGTNLYSQNIGINATGASPEASAGLDQIKDY